MPLRDYPQHIVVLSNTAEDGSLSGGGAIWYCQANDLLSWMKLNFKVFAVVGRPFAI
jgi:hypothetical protein